MLCCQSTIPGLKCEAEEGLLEEDKPQKTASTYSTPLLQDTLSRNLRPNPPLLLLALGLLYLVRSPMCFVLPKLACHYPAFCGHINWHKCPMAFLSPKPLLFPTAQFRQFRQLIYLTINSLFYTSMYFCIVSHETAISAQLGPWPG